MLLSTDSEANPTTFDKLHEKPVIKADQAAKDDEAIPLARLLKRSDAETWFAAIEKENLFNGTNFHDNRPALRLVDSRQLPADAVVYHSLMFGRVKRSGQKKLRWCVDPTRTKETTTPESRAPTVSSSTLLVALALLASNPTWILWQCDVTGAYTLANPERKYHIRMPAGWIEYCQMVGREPPPPGAVAEVLKNLYGSVDAARVWFNHIVRKLTTEFGFHQCPIDRCAFRLTGTSKAGAETLCLLFLYVDDIFMIGDQEICVSVQNALRNECPITESTGDYLGMEIHHVAGSGEVRVTQTAYARKILATTGMTDSKPTKTPLPTDFTASNHREVGRIATSSTRSRYAFTESPRPRADRLDDHRRRRALVP